LLVYLPFLWFHYSLTTMDECCSHKTEFPITCIIFKETNAVPHCYTARCDKSCP